MSKIKNVVFDLGGVVVDIDRSNAVKEFEKAGVYNADELLDKYHQKGIFLQAENGEITASEFVENISKCVGKEITYKQAYDGWNGFITNVDEYKLEYILGLRKRGYKVFVLSNTNPFVMEWARSSNFSKSGHDINYYFDKVYASYEMKCVKPERKIFEMMINDSGINPKETLFVDDGEQNVKAGEEIGFATIKPENGEDWREKVEKLL